MSDEQVARLRIDQAHGGAVSVHGFAQSSQSVRDLSVYPVRREIDKLR